MSSSNCVRRPYRGLAALLCVGLALANGCSDSPQTKSTGGYGGYGSSPIKFKDDAQSNREVASDDLPRKFQTVEKQELNLTDYENKKNVVLVFTRGLGSAGTLCPFCLTQTSRFISNYSKFTAKNAEVVVVFPGPSGKVAEFADKAAKEASGSKVPFPLVLDEALAQVAALGIEGDLAKPSTYILDKQGKVRFAYVGSHTGDRPSVNALLAQLDAIEKDAVETGAASATP